MKYVDSVRTAVRSLESDAIGWLQEMIRIPSITGFEADVQHHMARLLQDMGLEVDSWCPTRAELASHPAFSDDGLPLGERPVAAARWRGTDASAHSLILNGHVDVVPVGDEKEWQDGPWSGAVRGGRVYGRGSCDMKGGLDFGNPCRGGAAENGRGASGRCGYPERYRRRNGRRWHPGRGDARLPGIRRHRAGTHASQHLSDRRRRREFPPPCSGTGRARRHAARRCERR